MSVLPQFISDPISSNRFATAWMPRRPRFDVDEEGSMDAKNKQSPPVRVRTDTVGPAILIRVPRKLSDAELEARRTARVQKEIRLLAETNARAEAMRLEAERQAAEAMRLDAEAEAKAKARAEAQARDSAQTCTCSHPGCSAKFLLEYGWVTPANLDKTRGDAMHAEAVCFRHHTEGHRKVPQAVAAWKRAEAARVQSAERRATARDDNAWMRIVQNLHRR